MITIGKLRSTIEIDGFRSRQLINEVKKFCFLYEISLDIYTIGWFNKIHFIKYEGEDNKIVVLKKWLEEIMELNQ